MKSNVSSLASRIRAANAAILAEGRLDAIDDFFTPDYVVHLTDQDMSGGHAMVRKVLGMLRRAFPELEVEVEILVEGDSRVAWQRTLRGIQEGPYLGFPASGCEMVWRDMVVSELRDGRIAEEWLVTDLAERLLLTRKG